MLKYNKALSAFLILFACVFSKNSMAQAGSEAKYYTDTVRLSLPDAEQRFIDQSLAIIVAKYDVDVAKAGILQAMLWYNPTLYYSQDLYNVNSRKYLDASPSHGGNYDVQVQQLFSIAGKHTNAVKLAKLDAQRAEFTFKEVMRSLKLELYTNFITLYADEQKMRLYDSQVVNLQKLVNGAEQQFKLGAIAGNEVIRLKAEMQDLKNTSITLQSELLDAQSTLKTLLNYPLPVYIFATGNLPSKPKLPPLADILSVANQNRSDLQLTAKDIEFNRQNLKYQRSIAVPDLTLGTEFDRAGNAAPNFYGINMGLGLPLFNRNQGQIAIARYQIKKSESNQSYYVATIQNQVEGSYVKLVRTQAQLDNVDPNYSSDLESLIQSALKNYNKRYISLLEFLDQLRTYTSAKTSLIDLNSDYYNAIQNLNYNIGTDYIK
jgi:cobalt-zinc-cadmium efflux system outer membrane protein